MDVKPRVLIIGAGATGCNVAHYLSIGGDFDIEVWERSCELGAGGSLCSILTGNGVVAELGAQVVSFEMQNDIVAQRRTELLPCLSRLRDPGVWPDPLNGSKLAHTEERPSPWWEHYAVLDGTSNLLSRILASSGAEVHLGRSALGVEKGERARVAHESGHRDFDAVVVSCICDFGGFHVSPPGQRRHASIIRFDGSAASALRALWMEECREMTFDNGCGLVTVWTWQDPIIATVHHNDPTSALTTWLRVSDGVEVLDTKSFVQHSFSKPTGCIVASENPLIVHCGDWCGGTGTFSSCIKSAKAAADRVKIMSTERKEAKAHDDSVKLDDNA